MITEADPEEVFTPEDFTKEHRMIGQSAEEFGMKELVPKREELEELNPDLLKSLIRKAGDVFFRYRRFAGTAAQAEVQFDQFDNEVCPS